jgi:hypothetical protein
MGQGEPKAHAERRGFQNRGWEKAGWEGFSSPIQEIAATASEQQGNAEQYCALWYRSAVRRCNIMFFPIRGVFIWQWEKKRRNWPDYCPLRGEGRGAYVFLCVERPNRGRTR